MGIFRKRVVFECVFYVLGVLEPVGFLVVGKSSEGFSCEYFVLVFECDENGVGVQGFKCLPKKVG